jgi:hypothetical protein
MCAAARIVCVESRLMVVTIENVHAQSPNLIKCCG